MARSEALAERHVEFLEHLGALEAADSTTARLMERARVAIAEERYADADSFPGRAEDAEPAAVHRTEAMAEQASKAARAQRATAAEVRAERRALAGQRLYYPAAPRHVEAASIAPELEARCATRRRGFGRSPTSGWSAVTTARCGRRSGSTARQRCRWHRGMGCGATNRVRAARQSG